MLTGSKKAPQPCSDPPADAIKPGAVMMPAGSLHLMPYHAVFVIQAKIGTFVLSARQEPVHLVLIQIHKTDITVFFLFINIVDTYVTI